LKKTSNLGTIVARIGGEEVHEHLERLNWREK